MAAMNLFGMYLKNRYNRCAFCPLDHTFKLTPPPMRFTEVGGVIVSINIYFPISGSFAVYSFCLSHFEEDNELQMGICSI